MILNLIRKRATQLKIHFQQFFSKRWNVLEFFCIALYSAYRFLYRPYIKRKFNSGKNIVKTTEITLPRITIHWKTFIQFFHTPIYNFIYMLQTPLGMQNLI